VARQILAESLTKTNKLISVLRNKAEGQKFVEIPEIEVPDEGHGGIESHSKFEKLRALAVLLNDQANQLDEWRETMIQLLLRPLVDQEEDELEGDEYENSTKQQEKGELVPFAIH